MKLTSRSIMSSVITADDDIKSVTVRITELFVYNRLLVSRIYTVLDNLKLDNKYDIRIIYMVFGKEEIMNLLSKVNSSKDIKGMSIDELKTLAQEIREVLITRVSETGGHMARILVL